MKLYNVNPNKQKFDWGEMDCIELGEHGRGRQLTIVPFHAPVPPTDGSNYEMPESDMYPISLPFMTEGSEEERHKAGMVSL